MIQLPSWLLGWLAFAGFVYVAEFLIAGTSLLNHSGSLLATIFNLIAFTAVSGTPGWLSFFLFMVISLPALFVLLSTLLGLASGSTAGLVAVALLTAAVVALGFF